jgi:D-sedoheptulose 7-phosphate isomerase
MSVGDSRERVREFAEECILYHRRFADELTDSLAEIGERAADCLADGGKLLFFGNGGSASQAQHLSAEFVNRFEGDRRALAAIALTADGALLTCIANDSSYEQIFARQIEALGKPGDMAIGLTTSGASPNVIAGLRTAQHNGLIGVAFSGRDGGEAAKLATLSFTVPGERTARIQEIHLAAGHILCALVEERLFPASAGSKA